VDADVDQIDRSALPFASDNRGHEVGNLKLEKDILLVGQEAGETAVGAVWGQLISQKPLKFQYQSTG
jgi:hypothetical protein